MDDNQKLTSSPPIDQLVVYSSIPNASSNKSKYAIVGGAIAAILILGIVVVVALKFSGKSTEKVINKGEYSVKTVLDSAEVYVTKDGFSPAVIKIDKGQSVTWTNQDTSVHQIAAGPHPTHSSLPELFSDPLNSNETYSFVFDTSGTYTVHDELNPLTNQATVIVN